VPKLSGDGGERGWAPELMRPARFEVRTDWEDTERCTLTPVGELDIASVPRLEQAVADALGRGARRLVLDLSELSFVDSSGLRAFLVLKERADAEAWGLTLARPSEQVRTIFEITDAAKALPVVEEQKPR
jgi:anti-anti-sigma factor